MTRDGILYTNTHRDNNYGPIFDDFGVSCSLARSNPATHIQHKYAQRNSFSPFNKSILFTLSLNQYTRCYCQLNFVDVVSVVTVFSVFCIAFPSKFTAILAGWLFSSLFGFCMLQWLLLLHKKSTRKTNDGKARQVEAKRYESTKTPMNEPTNERTNEQDRANEFMKDEEQQPRKKTLKNVGLDIYVDPNEKSFSFN